MASIKRNPHRPPVPPAGRSEAGAQEPPEVTDPSARRSGRKERRGHGRVTLQEVAAHAQVTSITVSRFLREPATVAPETAARIRQALQVLGYVPNKQAGQLASGRSRMVAAIIPSIANSIFAETVQGLSDRLQAAGYELLLASTGYSIEREEEQVRAVLGWFPSALVVTGRHHTEAALALLRGARASGTPVIEMWDRQDEDGEFVQVGFNHRQVGADTASYLLERGYRELAFVDSGVREDFRAHERGDAFEAVAVRAGARVQRLVAPRLAPFDAGREALRGLLKGDRPPRAVAFANDNLACGALLEAGRLGVAVPGELALIGFGDFALGAQLTPALTTIRPPRYEIGAEVATQLLAALEGEAGASAAPLSWQLVERGSA